MKSPLSCSDCRKREKKRTKREGGKKKNPHNVRHDLVIVMESGLITRYLNGEKKKGGGKPMEKGGGGVEVDPKHATIIRFDIDSDDQKGGERIRGKGGEVRQHQRTLSIRFFLRLEQRRRRQKGGHPNTRRKKETGMKKSGARTNVQKLSVSLIDLDHRSMEGGKRKKRGKGDDGPKEGE